jgi:hypothetical protein
MATNTRRIAPTVTDLEIIGRIEELERSTDEDDMFDDWSNVAALEAELEARGLERPSPWADWIAEEQIAPIDPDAEYVLTVRQELFDAWQEG